MNLEPRIRSLVEAHVGAMLHGIASMLMEAAPRGLKRQAKRDYTCIAPGCKEVSKGPRFHYLCQKKHLKVSKKVYERWAKAAAVKRAERGANE